MTEDASSKKGPRIPEGPEDMPGGPHGGKPITPKDAEKKRKKKKKKRPDRDAG